MNKIKYMMRTASLVIVVLPVFIMFFMTSCQKSFDPKSYAPVQTFGGYSASNQVASSSLVAYWAFDGSLIDSVSNTSATSTGTTFSTGIKGQGMQIGIGNYASFIPTTAIQNLTSLTLTYWVNTAENTNGIQEPICFVDSNQFWSNLDMYFDGQTTTSSVLKVHAFGSAGAQEIFLTNWSIANPWGVWLAVALTYDASSNTFTLYANGALVGSSAVANFGPLNFKNFPAIVFGTIQFETTPSMTSATTSQSWASYLSGILDQVRIYNTALPASDIKALYQLENLGK